MQRIFVGDVQGCADELEILLDRAEEAFSAEFELFVAGDLVNRGPANLRALERVRELVEAGRAEYILGNHEIHLISTGLGLRELFPNDSIEDVLETAEAEEWVDWLLRRPVVVSGDLSGQPFVMLHASVAPAWSFEEVAKRGLRVRERLSAGREEARKFLMMDPQEDPVREDLARLTRGRAGSDTSWSSEEPATSEGAWHHAWSRHQHDYGIVYGHWARQGLHVARGLRGLDTGCVHHGRGKDGFLTAWLPRKLSAAEADKGARVFDAPDEGFWQIPASRRYYYPTQDEN